MGAGLIKEGYQSKRAELRADKKLGGVHAEEATFTFCGVNWETPFQGPFFEVVDGFLDGISFSATHICGNLFHQKTSPPKKCRHILRPFHTGCRWLYALQKVLPFKSLPVSQQSRTLWPMIRNAVTCHFSLVFFLTDSEDTNDCSRSQDSCCPSCFGS